MRAFVLLTHNVDTGIATTVAGFLACDDDRCHADFIPGENSPWELVWARLVDAYGRDVPPDAVDEVLANVNGITWGYTQIADADLPAAATPYDTVASLIDAELAYPTG